MRDMAHSIRLIISVSAEGESPDESELAFTNTEVHRIARISKANQDISNL